MKFIKQGQKLIKLKVENDIKDQLKIFQNKTNRCISYITDKETDTEYKYEYQQKKLLKTQDVKIIRNKNCKLYYPYMFKNPQTIIQSTKYCNSSKLKHKELCDYFQSRVHSSKTENKFF